MQVPPADLDIPILGQLAPAKLPFGDALEPGPLKVVRVDAAPWGWAVPAIAAGTHGAAPEPRRGTTRPDPELDGLLFRVPVGVPLSRRPVQPCPNPRLRLILPNLEDPARGFGPCPNTPPGNKRAREGGIREIDRESVIQHAPRPRRRYCPPRRAAILVEPGGYLCVALAESRWRNGDTVADGEASLGCGDHLAWVA